MKVSHEIRAVLFGFVLSQSRPKAEESMDHRQSMFFFSWRSNEHEARLVHLARDEKVVILDNQVAILEFGLRFVARAIRKVVTLGRTMSMIPQGKTIAQDVSEGDTRSTLSSLRAPN